MFDRAYYTTHSGMMKCVSNDELRDRNLTANLFRDGECVLNDTHANGFVIGDVAVFSTPFASKHSKRIEGQALAIDGSWKGR